jgi:hypothetical protein
MKHVPLIGTAGAKAWQDDRFRKSQICPLRLIISKGHSKVSQKFYRVATSLAPITVGRITAESQNNHGVGDRPLRKY